MRNTKQRRLEAAGWRVGNTQQFLGLTDEEAMLVEVCTELALLLRRTRTQRAWTQAQLAEALGSSQSRVAKMEAADPSVSIDLLLRGLIATGASGAAIGRAFAGIAGHGRAKS